MTHEFNQIDDLINTLFNLKPSDSDINNIEAFKSKIVVLFNSLQKTLELQIFQQKNQERLTLFVRYNQVRLTTLADSLHEKSLSEFNYEQFYIDLTHEIFNRIIDVLQYLHLYFAGSFDFSASLPLCFFDSYKNDQHTNELILDNLAEKGVDPKLLKILKEYLNCMGVPCDFSVKTWQEYDYLLDITETIRLFSLSQSKDEVNLKFILLLIGQNFNTIYFYDYMLDFVEALSDRDSIYEVQETKLFEFLKIIEDVREEHKDGFNPALPFIRDSISGSIRRDLERISSLKLIYQIDTNNGTEPKDFYFDVVATIEEFFFVVRLLLELNYVKIKYKSSLYKFVERYIRFERSKTPSSQYMRNVFSPGKDVPLRIIKRTRSILILIVSYLDKNYGDHFKFCLAFILFCPADIGDLYFLGI